MKVGTRVQLTRDVDRYPHFIAAKGSTGTVTHSDEQALCVRMDEHVPGAETWDNEVHWYSEMGDDDAIADDLQILDET